MIRVYHMTHEERKRTPMSWISAEELKVTRATHLLVAILKDCNSKGEAFQLTNHITHNWTENKGVDCYVNTPRSTSAGDVLETDKGLYLVDGVGFIKTDWSED